MDVKFKEDTTYIQDLEGVLKTTIKGRILSHHVAPLTTAGENYGSEILKVDITTEENGEQKQVHAVAKLIPPTQMQLEIFNTQVTFKNEIGFYAKIVPALVEFEREYGIVSSIGDYVPQFYGARISLNPESSEVDENAIIVMENLKVSGYTNIDRLTGFDLDGAKSVLRVLAAVQATFLALRKKKPEVYASRISPYLAEWNAPHLPLDFDSVLKENPTTSSLIQRVNRALAKKRVKKIRESWATITHNDLWVNNIMVQETNGTIDGIKLVDFQMPDLASPAEDVIFFLFTSVQTSVVQYHFEKLLRYYYNEFIRVLQSFKIDIKEFTYESFQEELRLASSFQVVHSLFMLMPILGPKEPPKPRGKAPEWNPSGAVGTDNGASPHGIKKNPLMEPFIHTLVSKEKIWFIVEEAAKRNWI